MIAMFLIAAVSGVGVAAIICALWEMDNRRHRADFSLRHDPTYGTAWSAGIGEWSDIPPARVFEEPRQ